MKGLRANASFKSTNNIILQWYFITIGKCLQMSFLWGQLITVSLWGFLLGYSFFLNVASSLLFLLVSSMLSSMDEGNKRTRGFHLTDVDQHTPHSSISPFFMLGTLFVSKRCSSQAEFLFSQWDKSLSSGMHQKSGIKWLHYCLAKLEEEWSEKDSNPIFFWYYSCLMKICFFLLY